MNVLIFWGKFQVYMIIVSQVALGISRFFCTSFWVIVILGP